MDHLMGYREVIPDLSNQEKWTEVAFFIGGTQSTLQDIKVTEKAGGYCIKGVQNSNRFIYWRTHNDFLDLSEISLDQNLFDNNVRYRFTDCPVLSVNIFEQKNSITILVATVCSLHRLNYPHPNSLDGGETRTHSIFQGASGDNQPFYVIPHAASSNNPIPHTANSYLSSNGEEAYFSLAFQTNLMLFTMNCHSGQTVASVLKENYIVPRIISNLAGVLRGKSNTSDSQYATSLIFNTIRGQTFLMALYRDNNIRMWSTVSLQCVGSIHCVDDENEECFQGPQINSLRKIDDHHLCAFLYRSPNSEFICIKIKAENPQTFSLRRINKIHAPICHLVDFEVTDKRIWALWCNNNNEFTVSSTSIKPEVNRNWESAALEPPPDRCSILVGQGKDAKQAYCSYIFHPGKFDKSTIAKALIMFRRSNILSESNIPMSLLKERVCQAIEAEIHKQLGDTDMPDESYFVESEKCWQNFYSCCEQYHRTACEPIGLVLLEPIGAICVVKKSTFSILRPCETLEHLMLARENSKVEEILASRFKDNEREGEDLLNMVIALSLVEQWITDEQKIEIENKLYELEDPDTIISNIISDITSTPQAGIQKHILDALTKHVQKIDDVGSTAGILLDNLRMDEDISDDIRNSSKAGKLTQATRHMFTSTLGVSYVAESVRQITLVRFALCRNLLILQKLIGDRYIGFQLPEIVTFIKSYYVLVWMCDTPIHLNRMSSVETSIQRMNLLQLTQIRPLFSSQMQSASLMRIFLDSKGLHSALLVYSSEVLPNVDSIQWQYTLLPILNLIGQVVWPSSNSFVFGEWLFGTSQHIIIQEYVRLLNNFCVSNICSRNFILAVSLIDCFEMYKAYEIFLQLRQGVLHEKFLREKILNIQDDMEESRIVSRYYLKVIQIFEQYNALDYVIELTKIVIEYLDEDDPQLPMFQSILFNNHLIIEHYEDAYIALKANEPSRRKDCLRQFVMCLFEKKKFKFLMKIGNDGLQNDFVSILESRARSMGIEENKYYSFLYAFHISQENMRKAASIIYEEGMRCLQDGYSVNAMRRRKECLLSCINALNLAEDNYKWIVKPLDPMLDNQMDTDDDVSLKQQLVVLEIEDVKKELLLTQSILTLAEYRDDINSSVLNAGANELSIILANNGLYTVAIKLAKSFNISLEHIFEALTIACVRTEDDNPSDSWLWLQERELADIPPKKNAIETAWALLQKLVEEHEKPGSTVIRKCVVNQLLSLSSFVPQWLHSSYKETNASELLRLYVFHGRLLEAAEFAKDYLATKPIVNPKELFETRCIPLNTFDMLLHGLKINSEEDEEYKESLEELSFMVDKYVTTAFELGEY